MANDAMMYWAKPVGWGLDRAERLFLFLCLCIVCVDGFHVYKKFNLSICLHPKNLQIDRGLSVSQIHLSVNTDRKVVILYVYLSIC
jgi:hypothetical protein